MTDVIDLDKRRRQREAEGPRLWRCRDCKENEFLLATDGEVICATCEEAVDDLRVQRLDEEES